MYEKTLGIYTDGSVSFKYVFKKFQRCRLHEKTRQTNVISIIICATNTVWHLFRHSF